MPTYVMILLIDSRSLECDVAGPHPRRARPARKRVPDTHNCSDAVEASGDREGPSAQARHVHLRCAFKAANAWALAVRQTRSGERRTTTAFRPTNASWGDCRRGVGKAGAQPAPARGTDGG